LLILNKKNITIYVLILFSTILSNLLYNEYNTNLKLTEKEYKLTSQYTNLTQSSQLEIQLYEEELKQLSQEKNKLNQLTDTLEKKQQSLAIENSNLTDMIDLMDKEMSSINTKLDFEKDFQIGNSLTSFYDVLRHEYGLDGGIGANAAKKELDFAAKMISHDLGNEVWKKLEDEYYRKIGNHSYIQASQILSKAVDLCEINDSDLGYEKLDKVLQFISKYVSYEYELDDISRAPVEILHLRSGDCEDFSSLTGAICRAVGINSALGSFANEENQGHVMIVIYLDNLGPGREYTYYNELHELGLKKGKWIIIEPQAPLDHQPDSEWFSQWKIQAAKEIN